MSQNLQPYCIAILGLVASGVLDQQEAVKQILEETGEELGKLVVQFCCEPVTPQAAYEFERAVREVLQEAGRKVLEQVWNGCDPESSEEVPHDVTRGTGGHRRLKQKTANRHVVTTFGKITLWRRGYRYWHREEKERTIFPLEEVLGLIEGASPLLVGEIGRMMAEAGATQQRVLEELFRRFGVRMSVARLRQITATVSEAMEEHRQGYQVAEVLELLEEAYGSGGGGRPVLSVGRDGIHMPQERGKGYQQGAVATVTVYDRSGRRLGTVYLAQAPERYQRTLTEQLTALITTVLEIWCRERGRPLPRLCYVTDAGETECAYYSKVLSRLPDPTRPGRRLQWYRIIDFFHASQRITQLGEALFGSGGEASCWSRRMRKVLRDDPRGISRVLHSAAALRKLRGIRRGHEDEFRLAYQYLRSRARHMRYAEYKRLRLPIGSGVTEAACKTVFTERLKLSGMGWSREGAQVILTLRVILLSGIWDSVYAATLSARNPMDLKAYVNVTSETPRIAA